jgi:hypothetical protein
MRKNTSHNERIVSGNAVPDFVREGLEAHRRAFAKVKANALRQLGKPRQDRVIISAIKNRQILRFRYNGKERIVEPQTYGISIAGREVLRAHQIGGRSSSGQVRMAKLFDLNRISMLRKTGNTFTEALSSHNPNDSAMVKIYATLPKPGK